MSFVKNIQKKWAAHVEKNKKIGEAAVQQKIVSDDQIKGEDIDELFDNFDPKKDKKKLTAKLRKKILEAEKYFQEGESTLKDLVAPSSVKVTPKTFKVNDTFARSYYVFNYPRFLESGWMSELVNFQVSMDIGIFIYPTESAQMMKVLRKKVAQMRSAVRMNRKRGTVEDVGLMTSLEDAESLRVDLQRGNERFFQTGVYITIYAQSEDKLATISKQIETLLGGQLIMTRAADFQTERGFESTLPQCTDRIDVVRNMNTSPLSTTFPFVSSDLTSNEGILYGINRHNNSLIIFDRFNLENANSVVFAKSGAGKSYAVKLEILRSMMMGTDVIVLDPENEYETLCNTVGGTYARISLNSSQRINPFDLPIPVGDDVTVADLLRENVLNLTGLIALMCGGISPEEESLLDQAIMRAYEIRGINENTPDPYKLEMPTMLDLQNILETSQGGNSMAVRLSKYTKGAFSGLFSGQTNIDLNSGLVCFCLRDLEDRLRPIAMYTLLNFIWAKVRSELKRRLLIVDEAWNVVQHEDSGRFLHNLVKRSRKYYLGITTITQDVEDFLDSPWGKPIITNSSMQVLLKQSPIAIEKLEKIFHLTEGEKYLLLNSAVGQGLFFAGNQHVAIQIIASYSENKIVTTNPEELLNNN